ncbi:MAG: helix-turn-helix transcriptional regulator [Hyphomonadaceae bacterium]|nr:helix-turn-helix transcriptional regulator [Hyphomonadaceae bacterium]
MARVAVGWSAAELAHASGVGEATIRRFETGRGEIFPHTRERVQRALEKKGVIFLASGENKDGGPGVRLKKK